VMDKTQNKMDDDDVLYKCRKGPCDMINAMCCREKGKRGVMLASVRWPRRGRSGRHGGR